MRRFGLIRIKNMSKIKIQNDVMHGMRPVVSPLLLANEAAQEARNLIFRSGKLEPMKGSTQIQRSEEHTSELQSH